jgi:uncharacterized protein (UPF0332 family)
MTTFDDKYFGKFTFTKEQVERNLANALKDLRIAKEDAILDVKFNYTYNALIKAGIALISSYGQKVKSVPGHHIKILEVMSVILEDADINDMGNVMRSKRNTGFYAGGIEVTEKECREYLEFVQRIVTKVKKVITRA